MKTEKTTHTPGPWTLTADLHIRGPQGFGSLAKVYRDGFARELAGITGSPEANARVMAAAPELLAALKFQASWTMRDGSPCACPAGKNEDEPRGKMPTIHSTSCEYLRAAIAKADGRAS